MGTQEEGALCCPNSHSTTDCYRNFHSGIYSHHHDHLGFPLKCVTHRGQEIHGEAESRRGREGGEGRPPRNPDHTQFTFIHCTVITEEDREEKEEGGRRFNIRVTSPCLSLPPAHRKILLFHLETSSHSTACLLTSFSPSKTHP